jgi:hypothetical protein
MFERHTLFIISYAPLAVLPNLKQNLMLALCSTAISDERQNSTVAFKVRTHDATKLAL